MFRTYQQRVIWAAAAAGTLLLLGLLAALFARGQFIEVYGDAAATALLVEYCIWGAAVWAAVSGVVIAFGLSCYWHESQSQQQTIQNYLDLPTEQLISPPKHRPNTVLPFQVADWQLAPRVEQLLSRIQVEVHQRENFLATMSHEIRTPMNGLIGFLSNLKETPLNDQQQQYLSIIDSSARSLLHVINQILDFSKLRAGQLAIEDIAFDLKAFAEERTALAKQSARGKAVKVHLSFEAAAEPVIIRTDPSRLRQILDNLLANAVKFTERGEVILEISVQAQANSEVDLFFAVRDSGIGMTISEQQKLFQPYRQADAISRRYGGTGLGLTIAHSLVELLGGELKLTSRPGEGSCFYFTLRCPVAKPEAQVHFSDLYHVRLPQSELKKHLALLVDDTPTNLFLLETICQSVGLPYRTAVNGREALELCREQHFDLIFMDIQMPIMNGYDAIKAIRKLPDAGRTAIVALTASAFQEDVDMALGAGSTGFIPKPFERDQLLLCIADHLGIIPERELREDDQKVDGSPEAVAIRHMHDFMREQYQISLGEIKMILAQTLADRRPLLDNLTAYAQQGNADETIAILQRLKGQLAAIGLLDHSEQTVAIMNLIREGDRENALAQIIAFTQSLTRIFMRLEEGVTLPK